MPNVIRIRKVHVFDDSDRAAIAMYMHRRYDAPLRKLATREQCQDFIREAMDNQDISLGDVLEHEIHCKECDDA